jgi:dolichyldiphosphatase
MPSSHANSLAFLSTYVAVAAAAPGAAAAAPLPLSATTALLVVGTPVVGIFLAWLRVALGYHSLPQVAVGWVVGATSAALWWSAGRWAVLPAAAASPALATGVYFFAAAAVAFFSLKHVARWAAERAPGGGGAAAA